MSEVYIIAEIGNTHEGSVGLAKQFIKAASDCGVNAVKFQTHIFEAESLSSAPNPPYFKDETRKEYFERTAFNLEQYKILKNFAEKECSVDFLSSPFSIEAVDLLLDAGVKTFKVPSGEVSNLPLIEYLAEKAEWVILSSGMSSWLELNTAIEILIDKCKLTVLQCTSEYPCLPENAGLNVMIEIRNRFNVSVGFSDHTIGIGVPIAAVVLGAAVIEKHFTLSKLMYGSDAKNSTEPKDFRDLVSEIRAVEKVLFNHIDKDVKVGELQQMKLIFEKSIVAKRDITNGTVIEFEDLAFKKPGAGIPASEFRSLIGKKINFNLLKDDAFDYKMFD